MYNEESEKKKKYIWRETGKFIWNAFAYGIVRHGTLPKKKIEIKINELESVGIYGGEMRCRRLEIRSLSHSMGLAHAFCHSKSEMKNLSLAKHLWWYMLNSHLEEFLREICNSHSNKWGKWHTHIHWRRRNNVSMNNGGDDLNGIWRAVVWRKEMAWDFCEWKREIEINEINSIESIE